MTFKQLLPASNLRLIFKIFCRYEELSQLKVKNKRQLYYLLLLFIFIYFPMLNILVKPNDITKRKAQNMLVFYHSQWNMSKITLNLPPYMIICFFVGLLLVLKILQALLSFCNLKFEIQKSILIILLKPTLNKNFSSVRLHLFWYNIIHYLKNRRNNLINFWFFFTQKIN